MVSRVLLFIARRPSLLMLALSFALASCAQTAQSTPSQPKTPPPAANAQPPAPAAAAETKKPAAPPTLTATSGDGVKIAYEVTGNGPALLLLHGGGQTRRSWNQSGYVDRLSKRFRVITMDLRGHGESDKPIAVDAYALPKAMADVLAVADAAKASRFHLFAFGHGATLGRHLAAESDRVISAVLVGTTMGPATTGILKDAIDAMRAKWIPLVEAHAAGKLDLKQLSQSDRTAWESGAAVSALSLGALLDYPPIEPAAIKAPTLWVVGADDSAMASAKPYEEKLAGTNVTFKTLSSINYSDSFTKIDQVMEVVDPFLAKSTGT